MWRRIARSARLGLLRRTSTWVGVARRGRTPVIVYQMGKVASSAVRNALLLHGVRPVLHLHSFVPLRHRRAEQIEIEEELRPLLAREIDHARAVFAAASWPRRLNVRYREWMYNARVFERCVQGGRSVKVITLVRDPVSANLSMFFQLFGDYAGVPYRPGRFSTQEILDIFVDTYDHSRPLTWFDAEMKPSLGLDVFRWPFPAERGHLAVSQGSLTLLILRSDLADAGKEGAISEFLGLEGFRMIRSNVARDKVYGAQYREVRRRLRLPRSLVERIYDSRYARHFFTDRERQRLRARWEAS